MWKRKILFARKEKNFFKSGNLKKVTIFFRKLLLDWSTAPDCLPFIGNILGYLFT